VIRACHANVCRSGDQEADVRRSLLPANSADDALQRRAAAGAGGGSRGRRAAEPEDQAHLAPHAAAFDGHALLRSGVPFNVIALWLGHESTNTTHRYVEANLEMKEKALARLEALTSSSSDSARPTSC